MTEIQELISVELACVGVPGGVSPLLVVLRHVRCFAQHLQPCQVC